MKTSTLKKSVFTSPRNEREHRRVKDLLGKEKKNYSTV